MASTRKSRKKARNNFHIQENPDGTFTAGGIYTDSRGGIFEIKERTHNTRQSAEAYLKSHRGGPLPMNIEYRNVGSKTSDDVLGDQEIGARSGVASSSTPTGMPRWQKFFIALLAGTILTVITIATLPLVVSKSIEAIYVAIAVWVVIIVGGGLIRFAFGLVGWIILVPVLMAYQVIGQGMDVGFGVFLCVGLLVGGGIGAFMVNAVLPSK